MIARSGCSEELAWMGINLSECRRASLGLEQWCNLPRKLALKISMCRLRCMSTTAVECHLLLRLAFTKSTIAAILEWKVGGITRCIRAQRELRSHIAWLCLQLLRIEANWSAWLVKRLVRAMPTIHRGNGHLLSFLNSQAQLTLFGRVDVVVVVLAAGHLPTLLDLNNILRLLLDLILIARHHRYISILPHRRRRPLHHATRIARRRESEQIWRGGYYLVF